MENLSPAEDLPGLYRAILDGIAELERLGERREAARVRADAIRAYSRSWDAAGKRRLEAILRHAQRAVNQRQDSRRLEVRRGVATTS